MTLTELNFVKEAKTNLQKKQKNKTNVTSCNTGSARHCSGSIGSTQSWRTFFNKEVKL